jgi:MtN3 and saliva related transmembrane protein
MILSNREVIIKMDYTTLIGLVAAALTVTAFFPQLMKVWKTKSTKDISLGMFSIFSFAVFLWFVYGVLIDNMPVIIANFLVFVQAFAILILKINYK